MKYKYFLIPTFLSVAALLMTADAAQAQRGGRGGGGGGGRGGGGVSRGGSYRGGYRGGFYGPGIGIGFYGLGYPYGYGYGYPSYYDSYPYAGPGVSYYSAPGVAVDPAPVVPAAPALPAVEANAAQIRVLVPDPQAKVWFDGALTSQGGTDRLYHSPALAAGNYSYRIRASWVRNGQQVVQEQVVPVRLGDTATVDFTRPVPSSEAVPPPK